MSKMKVEYLTPTYRYTLELWEQGQKPPFGMSRANYFVHRRQLLKCGIDIGRAKRGKNKLSSVTPLADKAAFRSQLRELDNWAISLNTHWTELAHKISTLTEGPRLVAKLHWLRSEFEAVTHQLAELRTAYGCSDLEKLAGFQVPPDESIARLLTVERETAKVFRGLTDLAPTSSVRKAEKKYQSPYTQQSLHSQSPSP